MDTATTAPADATSSAPPARRRGGRGVVLAFFLLLVGLAAGGYWFFSATYHLATVEPGVLYRDGNQSVRQFRNAMRKTGSKTVVMLVDDGEVSSPKKPQFAQEIDYLRQQGIRIERIPVQLGGWPTTEDVQRFLRVVEDSANRPVLVHCAQGVRRTGMMVAAYQMSVKGYDAEKAKAAIQSFGHSERTVRDVKTFIDGYDAAHQTATPHAVSDVKE